MKINVTCSGCQRVMRVGEQHVGKKGKCPTCGTVNYIQPDPSPASNDPPAARQKSDEDDILDAIPIPTPAQPTPTAAKKDSFAIAASDFSSPSAAPRRPASESPYQAPNQTGGRAEDDNSQPDIPGILGVVAGGLSLLGLTLCVCFGPIVLGVVVLSIGGLICSCFGRPPLKGIGIGLNIAALVITLAIIVVGVVLYFTMLQQQPGF